MITKPVKTAVPNTTKPTKAKLNVVEERCDTHTSIQTDLNLSLRSRIINKLQKKIKM